MIKKPKGYDDVQPYEEFEKLPAGGYVLNILEAADGGDHIELQFDIAEGNFKDFFANQYKNSTLDDKKWKGRTRIWLPKDDGSEQDTWTNRKVKTIMTAFEDSNEGFRWEWDETKLKGLKIGALFNLREYDFNGKQGFYTQCKKFVTVDKIKNGAYTVPEPDYLNKSAATDVPDGFEKLNDGDIPF